MSNKSYADDWIKWAYDNWLYGNDYCKTYLRPSTQIFVRKMKAALHPPQDSNAAWTLLELLKKINENYQTEKIAIADEYQYEQSEILLECALTAYWLRDLSEAQVLIRDAIGKYDNRSLNKAFARWLQGCVMWTLPSRIEDAIFHWEQSLQVLCEYQYGLSSSSSEKKWVQQVEAVMKEAIKRSALSGAPPSPVDVVGRTAKRNLAHSTLLTLPVVGEIPAGIAVNVVPHADTQMGVVQAKIDGEMFRIVSLAKETQIKLNPHNDYFLLKVVGDSMNKASPINIWDGDYVLLRRQKSADNGDIVAAEIIGHDSRATLKRYHKRSKKHILQAESANPAFQKNIDLEYEFTSWDDSCIIRGVVVAVLCPA